MNSSPNYMSNRNNEKEEIMMVEESDSFGALPTRDSMQRRQHSGSRGHRQTPSARTQEFREKREQAHQEHQQRQQTTAQDLTSIDSEKTWIRGSSKVCRENALMLKNPKSTKKKQQKNDERESAKKKKGRQRRSSSRNKHKDVPQGKEQDGDDEGRSCFPPRSSKPTKVTTPMGSIDETDSNELGEDEQDLHNMKGEKPSSKVVKLAAKLRSDRIRNGQCPTCGILLYKVKIKGVFRRVIQRKPITLEGQVDRGKCLMCSNKGSDNAAAVVVSAMSSSIDDFDKKKLYDSDEDYANISEAAAQGSQASYDQVGQRRKPFNAADLTNARDVKEDDRADLVSLYSDAPNNYMTGKPQNEDMDRVSMEEFACVPNTRTETVYEGGYNHLGAREGRGELFWTNGDRYSGDFARNARHGQGSLFFANDGEYVGLWCNDKMHGAGTRRYGNGDVYTGDYVGGIRHGQGQYFFANGDLYTGSFQNGQFHGFGRYYYRDGPCFEGTYANGLREGKGKFQSEGGEIDVQRYGRDERVGEGVRWSVDRSEALRLHENTVRGHVTQLEAAQIVTNCDCESWETMDD